MRALWIGLLAMVATGCATTSPRFNAELRFADLPRHEQARFAACLQDMDAVCAAGDARCVDTRAREYAARTSERMRQRFLIENGCSLERAQVSGSEARFAVTSRRRARVEVPAIEEAEPVVLPLLDLAAAEEVHATR